MIILLSLVCSKPDEKRKNKTKPKQTQNPRKVVKLIKKLCKEVFICWDGRLKTEGPTFSLKW